MVGSWVKIRQTNGGVWKDAELTRYYPNRGEYELSYIDGSTYAQGPLGLHRYPWFPVQELERQSPALTGFALVRSAQLFGEDGLWRTAMQSTDEEVAAHSREFLLLLYCCMHSIEAASLALLPGGGGEGGGGVALQAEGKPKEDEGPEPELGLEPERVAEPVPGLEEVAGEAATAVAEAGTVDLRWKLVAKVKDGLGAALRDGAMVGADDAAAPAGAGGWELSLCRHVDILQRFVDKHTLSATASSHGCGGRGRPTRLRLRTAASLLPEGGAAASELRVHDHVCALELYVLVERSSALEYAMQRSVRFQLPIGKASGGGGGGGRHGGGSGVVPRSRQTLRELGLGDGDEVFVELALQEEAEAGGYSPGAQISQSAEWPAPRLACSM